MGLPAGQRELQPPQALTVGDDADLLVFGFEDRALLDVIFEIGVYLAGADFLVTDPADAFQFVAEEISFGILAVIGEIQAVRAGKRRLDTAQLCDPLR